MLKGENRRFQSNCLWSRCPDFPPRTLVSSWYNSTGMNRVIGSAAERRARPKTLPNHHHCLDKRLSYDQSNRTLKWRQRSKCSKRFGTLSCVKRLCGREIFGRGSSFRSEKKQFRAQSSFCTGLLPTHMGQVKLWWKKHLESFYFKQNIAFCPI